MRYDASSPNPLAQKLLGIGGRTALIPEVDEDYHNILNNGKTFDNGSIREYPGRASQCHSNCAEIWLEDREKKVATGYALTKKDGVWRCHSWLISDHTKGITGESLLIETTVVRDIYFGVILRDEALDNFVWCNS